MESVSSTKRSFELISSPFHGPINCNSETKKSHEDDSGSNKLLCLSSPAETMASTKVLSSHEDDVIKRPPSYKSSYSTSLGTRKYLGFGFISQAPTGIKGSFSSSCLQSMPPSKAVINTKPTFLQSIGVPSLGMKKSVSLSSLESLASKVACHEDLIRLSHSFRNLRSSYPCSGFGSANFNNKALPAMNPCYSTDCEHMRYYISPVDGRRIRRTPIPHYMEHTYPEICDECSKRHIPGYPCRGMACTVCYSTLHFSSECPYLGYFPKGEDFDSKRYVIICQFGHSFDLDRWCCPYCTAKQAKLCRKLCSICLAGEDHITFDCPKDVACAARLKSEWENQCEAHAIRLLKEGHQSSQEGSRE